MMRSDLGYDEKSDALRIRIEAHKKYSNFSLEDWLAKNLPFAEGDVILDIGCGGGNFFPAYSHKLGREGVIVGVDKGADLLTKARNTAGETPRILLNWDMDQPFPFITESFDHVISSFAIYYARDVAALTKQIRDLLKPGGECLLIGPANQNAAELYEFNMVVFGIGRSEKVGRRTERLEVEFLPAVREEFSSCSSERIDSKLVFPDALEFLKYYRATLLFSESIARSGMPAPNNEVLLSKVACTQVSKEMIVVRGKK
jgi:SAM-dependent methyltransferase